MATFRHSAYLSPGRVLSFGWDDLLETYYFQVEDYALEESMLLDVGDRRDAISTVADLELRIADGLKTLGIAPYVFSVREVEALTNAKILEEG